MLSFVRKLFETVIVKRSCMCESAVLGGTADSQSKLSAWEVDAKPFRVATYHNCMTIITKRNKEPAGLN